MEPLKHLAVWLGILTFSFGVWVALIWGLGAAMQAWSL